MTSGRSNAPQLSTSRIHRLLRPLRTKCASLAAFADTKTRAISNSSTYSARGNGISERDFDAPPLLILQPPATIGSRVYFDKHNVEGLEMSRKVYAVRDCFKDIVVKTKSQAVMGEKAPTMGLAAMCSIVIGANLECDIRPEEEEDDDNDNDDDDNDNEQDEDFVDDIYNTVPLEYRRWTLLSHAVSLILTSTAHHPTLLSTLLDISLENNLFHESYALMSAFISMAFSSTSTSNATPRICHPAHATFLQDLRSRWNASGLSDRAFFQLLVDVLETVQSTEAWACKSVHAMARAMFTRDFPSFMRLIGGSTRLVAGASARSVRNETSKSGGRPKSVQLRHRFYRWTEMALDYLLSTDVSSESQNVAETSNAVLSCLLSILASGLHHTNTSFDDLGAADSPGMILCLATHWLLNLNKASSSRLASIIDRLAEVSPPTSAYSPLMEKIFSESCLTNCQGKLDAATSILRSYGLMRLEASMWACALRQIELSTCERLLATCNSDEQIRKYRHRLIELVDEAENRCFGLVQRDRPFAAPQTPRFKNQPSSKAAANQAMGAWRWEAMVGCWIRGTDNPTSAKKKRKISFLQCSSRRLRHRATHTPHKRIPRLSLDPSTRSSRPSKQTRGSHSENDDSTSHVCDNLQTPLIKRPSAFASRLSDAFAHRTVLHGIQNACDPDDLQNPQISPIPKRAKFNFEVNRSMELPSDDSLDLFACVSSSPP